MSHQNRNILVVMTDDHGQWCLGTYGNEEVHTPTIDSLADRGVRMENAFCPTPVCSPARASFFTGRRPSQHGVHDWIAIGSEYDGPDWLADEVTLPELLSEAGYQTAMVGKWHCGHGHDDEVFDYTANMHHDDWDVPKFSQERDRRITDEALEYLRTERDADQPFFLFVGLTATHWPWRDEPDRLVDQYRGSSFDDVPDDPTYRFGSVSPPMSDPGEPLAQYYAEASAVDEQVGRLVDELQTRELFEDTLIMYTADHGHNCGHHGIWGKGNSSNPPNVLEESIRVPLVVSGHEEVAGGQVREEIVDHCDSFQTLLEFAGVEPPAGVRYPGESYLPQVTGPTVSGEWDQVQVCEYGNIRMVRSERHKFVHRYPDGPDLLFDLDEDPRETRNMIDDLEYESVAESLRERLETEFDAYVDPESAGVPVEDLPRHSNDQVWSKFE